MAFSESRPTLPQEIQEIVVDHLHNENDTLSTCSLVCKAWLPVCRFHLFHTIHLGLDTGSDTADAHVNSFREFLIAAPRFIPLIKVLDVHGDHDQHVRIQEHTLTRLLKLLPGLRVVELYGLFLRTGNARNNPSSQPESLFATLAALRELRGLSLFGLVGQGHQGPPELPPGSYCRLESLEVFATASRYTRSIQQIFHAVGDSRDPAVNDEGRGEHRLRHFGYDLDATSTGLRGNLELCGGLIKSKGEHIRSLTLCLLDIQPSITDLDFMTMGRILNMESCINLVDLDFVVPMPSRDFIPWILLKSILSCIPPSRFPPSIRLSFKDPDLMGPSDVQHFEAFDRLVDSIPRVEQVVIATAAAFCTPHDPDHDSGEDTDDDSEDDLEDEDPLECFKHDIGSTMRNLERKGLIAISE